ncbi:hypothetical protein QQF64_018825 [Cirrhinus molitorella]|uniref:Uncharacterized protein n=1 Tax=Cirrhinus molitorella TaxID=172907 RepID=A0ABR3LDR0_9TELE
MEDFLEHCHQVCWNKGILVVPNSGEGPGEHLFCLLHASFSPDHPVDLIDQELGLMPTQGPRAPIKVNPTRFTLSVTDPVLPPRFPSSIWFHQVSWPPALPRSFGLRTVPQPIN